jgi:serine-type D-Ala-D-Ala carboxypeptidase (penicillin-binding protein 5/6)
MNTTIVSLVLAVYQLLGIKTGPAQNWLEQALIKTHTQPSIEAITELPRHSLPVAIANEPLSLSAASAYAVDAETMTPIFSLNPDKTLPIASITKIGMALVVLKDHSPDQVITIPPLPPYGYQDALIKVIPGEQFRFDQLLAAALIPSANDAADSLAITAKGSNEAFSNAMNSLIGEWGIDGIHYSNPSGLTDADNYATARSLAKLAKLGLVSPLFAQLTSTSRTSITSLSGRVFELKSSNELLGKDPRITGIKTGFTPLAGQCFVGLANIKGHRVITVILGSSDRFGETKQLLDWIERNWEWK